MRNYEEEIATRIAFIRDVLAASGAKGIVYGNSGGKDSALVGILCRRTCENTVGVIMPCGSKRNYGADKADAIKLAERYDIEMRFMDLSNTKNELSDALSQSTHLTDHALANIGNHFTQPCGYRSQISRVVRLCTVLQSLLFADCYRKNHLHSRTDTFFTI